MRLRPGYDIREGRRRRKGTKVTKRKGPPPKKVHLRLQVISEEDAVKGAVLDFQPAVPVPVIKSTANPNLVMECGNCGARLIQGAAVQQLQALTLRCPKCRAFNRTVEG